MMFNIFWIAAFQWKSNATLDINGLMYVLSAIYFHTFSFVIIGNLLVPNDNYCKFEDWVMPILDKMLEEQKSEVGDLSILVQLKS